MKSKVYLVIGLVGLVNAMMNNLVGLLLQILVGSIGEAIGQILSGTALIFLILAWYFHRKNKYKGNTEEPRSSKYFFWVVIGIFLFLFFSTAIWGALRLVTTASANPVELVGGSGERIYLRYGVIYANTGDSDKEYHLSYMTIHATAEQYKEMAFFDSPAEAETAGYVPSKNFQRDYDCYLAGKTYQECYFD